jgi:hypothetical protein
MNSGTPVRRCSRPLVDRGRAASGRISCNNRNSALRGFQATSEPAGARRQSRVPLDFLRCHSIMSTLGGGDHCEAVVLGSICV